ncbi:uncharacterized protein METZ01_LOCUS358899, partial [marine metagenome]
LCTLFKDVWYIKFFIMKAFVSFY